MESSALTLYRFFIWNHALVDMVMIKLTGSIHKSHKEMILYVCHKIRIVSDPLVSNDGDSYVVRFTSNIDSRVAFMCRQQWWSDMVRLTSNIDSRVAFMCRQQWWSDMVRLTINIDSRVAFMWGNSGYLTWWDSPMMFTWAIEVLLTQ